MKINPIFLALVISTFLFTACGYKSSTNNNSTSDSSAKTENAGGLALSTEIPPENYQGTPSPIKLPNLQQKLTETPVLMVPEDTVLLSAKKEVSGSDDFPIIGEMSYITDGDKNSGEGYFVELMDGLQWIQIDLGTPAEISAIWIWHYHFEKFRAYHDVIVQVSNDAEFKDGVTTLFNNDYDNSAQMGKGSDRPYVESRFGKLIDAKGTKARYVRLYSQGNTSNDMNHYVEVEVYGIPNG